MVPDLQSGHLLLSLRSRCRVCGKEVVDPTELPEELIDHGIQVSGGDSVMPNMATGLGKGDINTPG